MKVKVAKTAGFCMGVRRAVKLTLEAVREHPAPIYTLGPLIHNPQVVEMLRLRGVRAVEEIPEAGTVVIRSHGVSPAVRAELVARGLRVADATCPRVARVHAIVRSHHQKGFLVVVLGDAGHAEVEGLVGSAGGEAVVVQSAEEVEKLPAAERVCLVAQTTQERERFQEVAQALRQRYADLGPDHLVIADTICDSTRNRQEEVRQLAQEVEAVVVVGGKKSANTRRLAEVAQQAGVPVFLVENEDDLPREELSRFSVVGLTAGASTPNWLIRRVFHELRGLGPSGWGPLIFLQSLVRALVLSNFYVALGAGGLALAASRLQGFWPDWRELVVSVLYVFAVHTLSALADPRTLAVSEPARARAFGEYRGWWLVSSSVAMLVAAFLSFSLGVIPGLLFLALAAASFLYPVRLIRREEWQVPVRSLAEVPGSKDIFMAVGWAVITVVLPLADHSPALRKPWSALVAFVLVLGMVFVRALLRDFRDIQADRLIGRETLPVVIGKRNSRRILYATLLGLGALITISTAFHLLPTPLGYLLLLPLGYAGACVPLFTRQTVIMGFRAETITDATFLLTGLIALFF